MRLKQVNKFDKYYKPFFDGVMEFNKVIGNDVNDETLIPLYTNLLKEEAEEMADAKNAEDELDSILDVIVVGSYLAQLIGYKLHYWQENILAEDYYSTMESIVTCCDMEDTEQAITYVEDIMAIFLELDIDHLGAINEVLSSNMSKFIKVEGNLTWEQQECYDLICKSIVDKGRYFGVTWQRVGDYIMFRDENGKCLKAPCFREPNLSQYIY